MTEVTSGGGRSYLLGEVVEETGAFAADISLDEVVLERRSPQEPRVVFVTPVHNQASIIARNLSAMSRRAACTHEVVIVVDNCSDATEEHVLRWARAELRSSRTLQRVTVVTSTNGMFETISENVGIARSSASWVISVQADMHMDEAGFDLALITALGDNSDIFAVGARGGHSLRFVTRHTNGHWLERKRSAALTRLAHLRPTYRPSKWEHSWSLQIGRCGALIDKPLAPGTVKDLYLTDTVMRGPLAFRRSDFFELGGYDSAHFFLGNDDHDLNARAYRYLGKRVAYLPVRFSSPLSQGSTRAPRSPSDQAQYDFLTAYYSQAEQKSFLLSGDVALDLPREIRRARQVATQ